MDISTKLNRLAAVFETALDSLVPPWSGPQPGPARLHEAMRYTLQAGGKRLRPVLVIAAAELFQTIRTTRPAAPTPPAVNPGSAMALPPLPPSPPPLSPLPAAAAIECVHTYSLIHDDLPCMDNDDLRRGRPTAHRAFDEATALLAGDALLTHAFALLANAYGSDPRLVTALVRTLAAAAGPDQLIAGQMADLLAEKNAGATAADLEFIHLNKTAAMIRASLVMGGLVGGAGDSDLATLDRAGRQLGLAFQIVDDVLDATADLATLGKTPGKDAAAGKMTYVKLHGIDTARRLARDLTGEAVAAFRSLPGDTAFLAGLAESMASRAR
ncbi:geranylgeranyl pyrophosphate synthase [Opitutaceae bacterium TAV1]|nr:geranylgeranyl pyrophosphate synthase [Opitutaceae bacterium TAV1]